VYHRSLKDLKDSTAFILAGGKSSRMGTDKAFLELGGRTLLTRAIEMAREVTGQVRLLGDRDKFGRFGMVVEDVYSGSGPLGGIHAGLMSTITELNLMLAVDLPFIRPDFVGYLLAEAARAGAVVTVPRSGGIFQPLCAVYRKEFSEVAERALLAGKNKIGALFGEVDVRVIDDYELERAGFDSAIFRNPNTPQEWEDVKLDFEEKKLN
jgi:molybdopterin-guanine dinucleotide biosynthesis protein A